MFSFGFYNSKNGDRKYNASHFGRIFDGVIQDGVFGTIGNIFSIEPKEVPSLQITLHPGKAWLSHTWNILDADMTLTFNSVNPNRKRTDAVVIEVSTNGRTNEIKIVEGTPVLTSRDDTPPTLTQTWDSANIERITWQYPLAYVTIYGSAYENFTANEIKAANIKNRINVIDGTEATKYITWTPLVTGATMNTSLQDYLPDWDNLFKEMMAEDAVAFNTWFTDLKNTIIIDQSAAAALLQLEAKIDNKILYGTGLPPSTLEAGQVYFQIEE